MIREDVLPRVYLNNKVKSTRFSKFKKSRRELVTTIL
jgi:hypothetical protein